MHEFKEKIKEYSKERTIIFRSKNKIRLRKVAHNYCHANKQAVAKRTIDEIVAAGNKK